MNFHISPFSPLRPQFASSSPDPARARLSPRPSNHDLSDHDLDKSGPVRIAVDSPDADDELTNDTGLDDTDSLSDASADDVTQDSRDVLVQRLNDLAERLSGANVRASSIEVLHRQVDNMERQLRGGSRDRSASRHSTSTRRESNQGGARPKSLHLPPGNGRGDSARGRENALGIMPPMSPSWFMSRFQRRPPGNPEKDAEGSKEAGAPGASAPRLHHKSESQPPGMSQQRPSTERPDAATTGTNTTPPTISSEDADSVVKEAEKLCNEMALVIESLRTRREESDYIHALLVQRGKMADMRLHETTAALDELTDVVADNEAELRHLRLELRAIEVQCMGYVPEGADPELNRSIRNWKDDWKQLREQFASRRGSSFVPGHESCTVSALTSPR